jgi:hypothetical protein
MSDATHTPWNGNISGIHEKAALAINSRRDDSATEISASFMKSGKAGCAIVVTQRSRERAQGNDPERREEESGEHGIGSRRPEC